MTPIKTGEVSVVGLNLNRRGGKQDVYVGVPKWVLLSEYEGRCLEERYLEVFKNGEDKCQ